MNTELSTENEKISALQENLSAQVFGQPQALLSIEEQLPIDHALTTPQKPEHTFLFIGPKGTGKKRLAKKLHHALYPKNESHYILNLQDYVSQENADKLLGTPPLTKEYGDLFKLISHTPNSTIVLENFDEISKAHQRRFLQFLKGELRHGLDCSQTQIIAIIDTELDSIDALDSTTIEEPESSLLQLVLDDLPDDQPQLTGTSTMTAPLLSKAKTLIPEALLDQMALVPFDELPHTAYRSYIEFYAIKLLNQFGDQKGCKITTTPHFIDQIMLQLSPKDLPLEQIKPLIYRYLLPYLNGQVFTKDLAFELQFKNGAIAATQI